MATLSKLKPGQIVYYLSRNRMGNTTIRTTAVHRVHIKEVGADRVMASWNGNPPRVFHTAAVKSWRVNKPYIAKSIVGSSRLATPKEVALAKVEGRVQESGDHFYILKGVPSRA